MRCTRIQAAMLNTGGEPPMVQITMDIAGWEFVLQSASGCNLDDECFKVIARACKDTLISLAPTVMMVAK